MFTCPKKHLKFTKLAKIMETKGNKILQNMKIKWTYVVCTFSLNAPIATFAKYNQYLMVNVKMLLGLNVIMPLLETIHSLIKFAQPHDVFVCNFITTMKICEKDIY